MYLASVRRTNRGFRWLRICRRYLVEKRVRKSLRISGGKKTMVGEPCDYLCVSYIWQLNSIVIGPSPRSTQRFSSFLNSRYFFSLRRWEMISLLSPLFMGLQMSGLVYYPNHLNRIKRSRGWRSARRFIGSHWILYILYFCVVFWRET